MKDGIIYAKCRHVIFARDVKVGQSCDLDTQYDWCPKCTEEILAKQKELQMTFDTTFGDINDHASSAKR